MRINIAYFKNFKMNKVLDYKINIFMHTFNSKTPLPIPAAAPDPAKPTKCPDPILLANKDAPT